MPGPPDRYTCADCTGSLQEDDEIDERGVGGLLLKPCLSPAGLAGVSAGFKQGEPMHPFPEPQQRSWMSEVTYEGQIVDELWEGQGRLIWRRGSYEGQFQSGKAHGRGKYVGANGNIYIGDWSDGHAEGYGEEIQQQCCSLRSYKGEWQADRPHGRGMETYPSGMWYHGEFQNGSWHGTGHCGAAGTTRPLDCSHSFKIHASNGENHFEDFASLLNSSEDSSFYSDPQDIRLARAYELSEASARASVVRPLPPTRKAHVFKVDASMLRCSRQSGIELDIVNGVSALVVSWNESNPQQSIQEHDRIIEVNGSRVLNDVVQRLSRDQCWRLVLQRPSHFTIAINVGIATNLGVSLCHALNGTSLLVNKVLEGPLQAWNFANPAIEVKVGDRIVSINGVSGKAETLLKSAESGGSMIIEINRYPSVSETAVHWKLCTGI